ncbi:hypothetical protein IWW36_004871, partial [Coemansia brasiliensis]
MFTPEREAHSKPISTDNVQSNPSPTGIAKTLVSQLLEKQNTFGSKALTASTTSAESSYRPRQTEPPALSKEAEPTKRARLGAESPPAAVTTSAAVTATPAEAAGTPCVDLAVPQPAVASTTGLGPAVSSSVLQNAISDALAPLSEQIRGEIRNLHLDIIRQGFMYQEQIRTLRQECSEARMLRQEIDRLRRENEQLRRYLCLAWKLGRLNHVAIAVPDMAQASSFWKNVMQAEKVSDSIPMPEHGVYTVFVELGNTKIELLHPLGDKSPIAGFLAKNKQGGIHHICLEVPDIVAALGTLKVCGVRPLSETPKIGAHGLPVVFLHPKDCGGVL